MWVRTPALSSATYQILGLLAVGEGFNTSLPLLAPDASRLASVPLYPNPISTFMKIIFSKPLSGQVTIHGNGVLGKKQAGMKVW